MDAEDSTIAAIMARVPHPPSPEGPGDDAAILAEAGAGGPRARRVVTMDLLLEGTHFLASHPPEALGWKALMVNLSDVAAMGAVPEGFCLGLGLPRAWDAAQRTRWVEAFAEGLGDAARAAEVALVGGDTVGTAAGISLAITAWGRHTGPLLRRDGARPGDEVWVKGPVGRAGEGLRQWLLLTEADRTAVADAFATSRRLPDCLEAQLRPVPPLSAGPAAAAIGATAGLDLSDGLARDVPRLALASGVSIRVDLDALPPDAALAHLDATARAASGEDYSLLVTAPPRCGGELARLGFVRIGAVEATVPGASPGVVWGRGDGAIVQLEPDYKHF
jgi:thiamine-monophosphate kinase